MFAKGDMVRVKAGSPRYCSPGSTMGPYETDYGKGFVVQGDRRYNDVVCCILSGTNAINAEYLEPWNDNEEWDGTKWVVKGYPFPPKEASFTCKTTTESDESIPPEFVMVKGIKYVLDPSYSVAEQVEKKVLGEIEKNSEQYFFNKPDWMAHVVGVTRTGNRLAITYDFGK